MATPIAASAPLPSRRISIALLKRDRIVNHPWHRLDDDQDLPSSTPVVVSYERWLRDRNDLQSRNGPIGVILASDQSPELIANDLGRFGLICLDFPIFTDGRAYSYARLLRARFDFAGEIRAIGAVLRDQLLYMRRCGFDSFVIPDDAHPADWTAAFNEISIRYQPTVDQMPTVTQLRLQKGHMAPGPHGGSNITRSWSY